MTAPSTETPSLTPITDAVRDLGRKAAAEATSDLERAINRMVDAIVVEAALVLDQTDERKLAFEMAVSGVYSGLQTVCSLIAQGDERQARRFFDLAIKEMAKAARDSAGVRHLRKPHTVEIYVPRGGRA
jgi:hypothetical protein